MSDLIVHKLYVPAINSTNAGVGFISQPVDIKGFSLYCVQMSWSSLSVVSPLITVSGSNSLDEPFAAIDTFVPTGSNGSRLLNVEKAGYNYVQVAYTVTSGSGNLKVTINGKVL